MTPHEAFMAAIIAAPDDDTPRLVYADWLEEHDQPERAEFIRVQCRLATMDEPHPPGCLRCAEERGGTVCDYCRLTARSQTLGLERGDEWDGIPDSIAVSNVVWRRGFVKEWTCPAVQFTADVLRCQPIEKLTLTGSFDGIQEGYISALSVSVSLREVVLANLPYPESAEAARRIFTLHLPGVSVTVRANPQWTAEPRIVRR